MGVSSRGQSFIALILLIGGIIALIGVVMAFVTNSSIDTGYGYQAAVSAEAAATSGAEDALLQLDRNASFATSSYSLAVGSTTASISVSQNTPSANLVTVLSVATVSQHTKKISVIVAKNASTSQMSVVSWQEIQ